jgi:hypothetical protein
VTMDSVIRSKIVLKVPWASRTPAKTAFTFEKSQKSAVARSGISVMSKDLDLNLGGDHSQLLTQNGRDLDHRQ